MKGIFDLIKNLFLIFLLISPLTARADLEEIVSRLSHRCRESKSAIVLIKRNGQTIFEYRSQPNCETLDILTATQSIASLAIGILVDEGKISVHQPLGEFFPEWNQGWKKEVTIRHLLNGTSGIQFDSCEREFFCSENMLSFSKCSDVAECPGTSFYYNPKAGILLAGIVQKVTGMDLANFLQNRLFAPLGIENTAWQSDRSGTTFFYAHLLLKAEDLIKIGEMLANEGHYGGNQLISKQWIHNMTQPGQPFNPFCGWMWGLNYHTAFCWWEDELIDRYRCCGVDLPFIKALEALHGRVFQIDGCTAFTGDGVLIPQQLAEVFGGYESARAFFNQVERCHLPTANWKVGGLKSYEALAHSGQQLIIFPEKNIVAVRLLQPSGMPFDEFSDFGPLVNQLTYWTEVAR
jgi:CubicO group peptidase (beta-lactamase class C family)